MPNPELEVSLLKPEEAEKYMRIRHEVFRPTVNKILYSRGEACTETLNRVTEEIRDGLVNKEVLYLKCVEKATGEMIAGARWRHVKPKDQNAEERTWEEVEAEFDIPAPFKETEIEMLKGFHDTFNENKREIMKTRPYYALDTLVTLSNHERRGAGSMLVRWGCERADEAGIEAYLEASPMGAPMYSRHGFLAVKRIELDLKQWGGEDVLPFIFMLRPANGERTP